MESDGGDDDDRLLRAYAIFCISCPFQFCFNMTHNRLDHALRIDENMANFLSYWTGGRLDATVTHYHLSRYEMALQGRTC